jgi:hypothetical protein
MGFLLGGRPVGATRHSPTDACSGIEPVLKDALTGPEGSPLLDLISQFDYSPLFPPYYLAFGGGQPYSFLNMMSSLLCKPKFLFEV